MVQDDQHNQYPHKSSSVTYEAGLVLYHLIREHKPNKSLEIGLAYGLSALFICQAFSDNGQEVLAAIDPYEEKHYESIGLLNIERAGLSEFLQFYQEPSYQVLAELSDKNETFDFAFIDGSHLFDYIIVDFFYIDKMLATNGLVVFDDLWMLGVRKAVSYILRNRAYELIRPSKKASTGWVMRVGGAGRRICQNPFGKDRRLKRLPQNVAILQKTGMMKENEHIIGNSDAQHCWSSDAHQAGLGYQARPERFRATIRL